MAALTILVQLDYMTNIRCFFSEFLGTAMLLIVVCAVTDNNNGPPPPGLVPLVLFCLIIAIGSALGMETGESLGSCSATRTDGAAQATPSTPRVTSAQGHSPLWLDTAVQVSLAAMFKVDDTLMWALHAVYNFRHQYWIWCPVLGPICGAIGLCFMHRVLKGLLISMSQLASSSTISSCTWATNQYSTGQTSARAACTPTLWQQRGRSLVSVDQSSCKRLVIVDLQTRTGLQVLGLRWVRYIYVL